MTAKRDSELLHLGLLLCTFDILSCSFDVHDVVLLAESVTQRRQLAYQSSFGKPSVRGQHKGTVSRHYREDKRFDLSGSFMQAPMLALSLSVHREPRWLLELWYLRDPGILKVSKSWLRF